MKILYVRTSSLDASQNSDRQKVDEKNFDLVFEDYCSGAIEFSNRPEGKRVLKLIEDGSVKSLSIWHIDRLGRDLLDILSTVKFCNDHKVSITFISLGLITIDRDGKVNPITKFIISMLGTVAEMELNQIKERQMQGIAIAKAKGKYLGRKKGTTEDVLRFLSKEKNQKALVYLKKGYKATEISKIVGVHINTIGKIKRIAMILK